MAFTKKTTIVWESLNETLKKNGTLTEFYTERDTHLADMVAAGNTNNDECLVTFVALSPNGIKASTIRPWKNQESADAHIAFIHDLVAKYNVAETYISGEVSDL